MANYEREMRIEVYLKRKKNRESNRVCRENEEGTGKSWNSIDKSTEML